MKVVMLKDYPLSETEVLKKGASVKVSPSLYKILQDGGYIKKSKR